MGRVDVKRKGTNRPIIEPYVVSMSTWAGGVANNLTPATSLLIPPVSLYRVRAIRIRRTLVNIGAVPLSAATVTLTGCVISTGATVGSLVSLAVPFKGTFANTYTDQVFCHRKAGYSWYSATKPAGSAGTAKTFDDTYQLTFSPANDDYFSTSTSYAPGVNTASPSHAGVGINVAFTTTNADTGTIITFDVDLIYDPVSADSEL